MAATISSVCGAAAAGEHGNLFSGRCAAARSRGARNGRERSLQDDADQRPLRLFLSNHGTKLDCPCSNLPYDEPFLHKSVHTHHLFSQAVHQAAGACGMHLLGFVICTVKYSEITGYDQQLERDSQGGVEDKLE